VSRQVITVGRDPDREVSAARFAYDITGELSALIASLLHRGHDVQTGDPLQPAVIGRIDTVATNATVIEFKTGGHTDALCDADHRRRPEECSDAVNTARHEGPGDAGVVLARTDAMRRR
jgi:hypothetical protein